MNQAEHTRVIEFAKANENRRYEKVYVLFLWISSIGIIAIGLVVTIGVIYMLTKEYNVLIAGECKPFIYGSAFLLCAGLLALISGILACTVTTTKGKFVLTIFFGHVFAIGLVTSGLILTVKMRRLIKWDANGENVIIETFRNTLNDSMYKENWIKIHKEFRCCGIDSLEKYISLENSSNDSLGDLLTSNEISELSIKNDRLFKELLNVAGRFGVKISYCTNIVRDAHRGCGILLLSCLEKKTSLLTFYGTLILPMIIIADTLFFLGYLCFKEIKISLMVDK